MLRALRSLCQRHGFATCILNRAVIANLLACLWWVAGTFGAQSSEMFTWVNIYGNGTNGKLITSVSARLPPSSELILHDSLYVQV